MLATRLSGAFLMIRLAAIVVLLQCSRLLRIALWLTARFFIKLRIAFSWLITACVLVTVVLCEKIAGVTWRLLVIGRAISLRLHSRKKAVNTIGT